MSHFFLLLVQALRTAIKRPDRDKAAEVSSLTPLRLVHRLIRSSGLAVLPALPRGPLPIDTLGHPRPSLLPYTEDTFILLDALEQDEEDLRRQRPLIVLEIGLVTVFIQELYEDARLVPELRNAVILEVSFRVC